MDHLRILRILIDKTERDNEARYEALETLVQSLEDATNDWHEALEYALSDVGLCL